MKDRHPTDDRVGKIHNQINRTLRSDVHCVQPLWPCRLLTVLLVNKKMHLMDMKRVDFMSVIDDAPMHVVAYLHSEHWSIHWRVFLVVHIETVFVLGQFHGELG